MRGAPKSILIILILILILFQLPIVSGTASFTRITVTPRGGGPDETYLFLTTYRDTENQEPSYVRLVIDDQSYDLVPVTLEDNNYTNGRDYMIRLKLDEGIHVFYYTASNGTATTVSASLTIQIEEENLFTHLDVAYSVIFATVVIIIPIIYGLTQLRRLARTLEKVANRTDGKEPTSSSKQTKKDK
jgi:hypothetical protein